MKRLLCSLIVLLFTMPAAAQETPTPSDWTTEQRCITAPSQPPEGWTYDGVIFTFKPGDGIHARRADMPTPYYIALDSQGEFGSVGNFSPDGKWFAVPAGHIYPDYTGFQNSYLRDDTIVDQIRVYSTTPAHTLYLTKVHLESMGSAVVDAAEWIDNQTLVFYESESIWANVTIRIFNPFSGIGETVTDFPIIPDSPDRTRAVNRHGDSYPHDQKPSYTLAFLDNPAAAEVELPILWSGKTPLSISSSPARWTADSTHFAARLNTELNQVGIFDRNGQLSDSVPLGGAIDDLKYSGDGENLAFSQYGGTIHIADFATRTITDTCIETPYSVAFSPDGRELAFGLEPAGYTYILDLAAWQAYRIDLAAADVVGWYPLE